MTEIPNDDGLEGALADAQTRIEALSKTAAALARDLKRARAAAVSGQVKDLHKTLAAAGNAVDALRKDLDEAEAGYTLDATALLADGRYAAELLAMAQATGLSMVAEEGQLLCYPSIVRVLPGELAIEIDRKRARGIRPSAVIETLRRAQQSGPKFRPGPFLASLAAGYDLVVAKQGKAPDAVVRLVDVYDVLTLLPGQAREYSKPEFARDLYLLDQERTTTTADGRDLHWAASSGTRQTGVLGTVAASGQQQRYWGVAFR